VEAALISAYDGLGAADLTAVTYCANARLSVIAPGRYFSGVLSAMCTAGVPPNNITTTRAADVVEAYRTINICNHAERLSKVEAIT
jgi:hypothetical protein